MLNTCVLSVLAKHDKGFPAVHHRALHTFDAAGDTKALRDAPEGRGAREKADE